MGSFLQVAQSSAVFYLGNEGWLCGVKDAVVTAMIFTQVYRFVDIPGIIVHQSRDCLLSDE